MLARQVTFPAPPKQANSFPATLLRTLRAKHGVYVPNASTGCAMPAPSFLFQLRKKRTKNAPVTPLSTAFTPNALATPLESAFTKNTGVWGAGQFAISPRLTLVAQRQNRPPLSTFRMNTCKSVTKQTTLSFFRMNTYAKTGGARRLASRHHPLLTTHSPLSFPLTTHYSLPTFLQLSFQSAYTSKACPRGRACPPRRAHNKSCSACKHFAPKCAQPSASRSRSSWPKSGG
jgi:hypothetical protein